MLPLDNRGMSVGRVANQTDVERNVGVEIWCACGRQPAAASSIFNCCIVSSLARDQSERPHYVIK